MILLDRPDDGAIRQVAGDGTPAPAHVPALENEGAEITSLVGVGHGEHAFRVVERGFHVVDEGGLGNPRELGGPGPGIPPVLRHMDQPIVTPHVEEVFRQG